jgi:hypothetical protein
MQIGTSHHLELPTGLRHKLETYRRRVWIVKLAEGLLAGLFGLIVSYLLVFVCDRFWDTPASLRLLLLVGGAGGIAIWCPLKWHRWVWQTRQLEQAARLLRHHFPRLGDQLLGIVELAHNDLEQERSESLCRAAMRQVDRQVRDCDFSGAVPSPRHRRWAWAAGVVFVLAASALVLVPAAGSNALARWLFPWRDTQRYTFAQLETLPDSLVVPYAEPFLVSAGLTKQSRWLPAVGRARYGRQAVVEDAREGRQYDFQLPPQKGPDTLTIAVGDARKRIHVEPTSRPELTEIIARVKLPDYLQYASYPDQDVRSGSLSVVKGSRVSVSAFATRELRQATIATRSIATVENRLEVPETLVDSALDLKLQWSDTLGLSAKAPFELHIDALDDDAPNVSCAKLQREQVVLSTETVSFDVLARDDFGVKLIGIEWAGIEHPLRNPNPASGEEAVAAGAPQAKELQATAAFSTERLGIEPQSFEVRLFAIDYLPGRDRVYSPKYIFHVLSPEEHAIWLTQQMRRWYQQANEVYEREQQLHDENKALRALPAEQLDEPETRRRIESQAAAEQANSRRLGSLTLTGEELVRQAMRNEQFNVASLETWAEMVQALKDIAEKRMPTVADLLTAAATAPGAVPPQQAASAETAKTPPQIGLNRDPRAGPAGKTKPAKDDSTVPSISDVESGFNELESEGSSEESKKSAPTLRLPATTVVGGGAERDEQAESCPIQAKMEDAVVEQADLLAEFAKVAEELKKLLGDLEGSTFVKRLKAASRNQLAVASELNESVPSSFGVGRSQMGEFSQDVLAKIAARELGHGDDVYVIQDDLEAYYNRVQQGKFRTVLNEMKSMQVVSNLHQLAKGVQANMSGQSIADAEFWADTLDRWAEQLVGPG